MILTKSHCIVFKGLTGCHCLYRFVTNLSFLNYSDITVSILLFKQISRLPNTLWGGISKNIPKKHRTSVFGRLGNVNSKFLKTYLSYLDITIPIPSMYGIFTYIWLILKLNMVNVGKYTIHRSYGLQYQWCFLLFKQICVCSRIHVVAAPCYVWSGP